MHSARRFAILLIGFVVIASSAFRAHAATIVGVVVNPSATAGGGATSTRSGVGSFHIYAIDQDNLGISSYNLTMGSIVTASNNRTPNGTMNDANGDSFNVGFPLLRSATNAAAMQGAQPLPGSIGTLHAILGMGQTAGSFTMVATSQGGVYPGGPSVSPFWGGPYNDVTDAASGKKWLFIGEGLWNTSMPLISALQFVSNAVITVFADQNYTSIASFTTIGPNVFTFPPPPAEPATASLLCFAFAALGACTRRRRA